MNRMERQRQCNVCYENVIRKEKELGQFVKDLYKDLEINSEQTWLANEIITKFENLYLRKMGEKFK
jgi:hypothetical protein